MIFVGVATDDVYSEKTLNYVKSLEEGIQAIGRELPGQNVASLLGLKPEEGAKIVEAFRGVGINEMNYRETLAPLVTLRGQAPGSLLLGCGLRGQGGQGRGQGRRPSGSTAPTRIPSEPSRASSAPIPSPTRTIPSWSRNSSTTASSGPTPARA